MKNSDSNGMDLHKYVGTKRFIETDKYLTYAVSNFFRASLVRRNGM